MQQLKCTLHHLHGDGLRLFAQFAARCPKETETHVATPPTLKLLPVHIPTRER
ncbi:BQ5605_C044g12177 [Microbotryum silenes-dioicae]|uniref:BQ5605_C033g11130 protein n=1 Tax=Microbotryum silenes-dioicae TaxID=796604 RepID=A0A2X0MGS4_9BASI|nr:BQ5605_C033g11130 [Microbotryum silenes-dioicae]SGZ31445.1 BQ5605_C044g12177 [Microbotryum silenes-dioicae]